MSFQSVPDCASAAIKFNHQGKDMVNVLHFAKAGGYDQAAIDDLAAGLDAVVDTDWKPRIANVVTYVDVTVKGLTDPIDLFSVNSSNGGLCSYTGQITPHNVTWAIRLTTGAIGRSSRGRMFVIGLTDTHLSPSQQALNSIEADAWVTALINTRAEAASLGWQLVVVSRFTNGAKRPLGVYRAVTGIGFFNFQTDSQRGRLLGT